MAPMDSAIIGAADAFAIINSGAASAFEEDELPRKLERNPPTDAFFLAPPFDILGPLDIIISFSGKLESFPRVRRSAPLGAALVLIDPIVGGMRRGA